jgi:hypothetical protein
MLTFGKKINEEQGIKGYHLQKWGLDPKVQSLRWRKNEKINSFIN